VQGDGRHGARMEGEASGVAAGVHCYRISYPTTITLMPTGVYPHKYHPPSDVSREKMRLSHLGAKGSLWKGGVWVNDPDYARKYYRRNAEHRKSKAQLYGAIYRTSERGRILRRHRDRIRAYHKQGAADTHTLKEWIHLKQIHAYLCAICGDREPNIVLTRDHIIPFSKGGTNLISNIQPLCGPCNSGQKDRLSEHLIGMFPEKARVEQTQSLFQ
jgi:5-methylcytosine-specific restriction endonuclease McrA